VSVELVAPAPELGAREGEALVDAVEEARAALRDSFKARTRSVKSLEAARAATIRARALVADLSGELEKHVHAGKRVSAMRTDDLKATLKAGKAPSFEVLAEIPAIAAKRAEAESWLTAAKQALEELSRDEAEAEAELQRSQASVTAAIKNVVQAAADEMAERILDLQAEADDLHERLGIYGSLGFLSRFLDPKNGTALSLAMSGQVWGFNGPEMKRSAAHQVKWQAFAKALETDPNVPLGLD